MATLENGTPLLFDLVALLTLQQSDGFPLLAQIKNDKYVAQSTIDEVEAELREVKKGKDVEDLNIVEINGQLKRHVVTIETKANLIENLTQLLQHVKNTTKAAQPPPTADFNGKKDMDRIIGKSFHDSLLIANYHNALLVSDDSTFRIMARNDFGTYGIPYLGLVRYLAKQHRLPLEKADAIHEGLAQSNYRHIPMRPDLLLRICQKANFKITQTFIRACDCLDPLIMDDEQATAFVANFSRMLSLQASLSTSRDAIVSFLLTTLYRNRNKPKVKALLIQHLEHQFILLPIQKKRILDIISFM